MTTHAIVYLLAFAAPGLIGFVSFGIYTRVLRPEEYAVYSVGVSIAFLIGNVVYGWLRFALGRYQSEAPDTDFMPLVLSCFAAVTVVLVPAGAAAGGFYLGELSGIAITAILFMTVVQALFDITQEARRARHQSGDFMKLNVGRSLASFTLGTMAAYLFVSGAAVVAGIGAGFALLTIVSLIHLRKHPTAGRVGGEVMRRFVRYGLPLSLSGFVFAGNATLARLIVGWMLGAAAAGHYGAALDVTLQLTVIVAAAISAIVGPMAFRAYSTEGEEGARQHLRRGAELFLAAMTPTVVGLALVAPSFGAVAAGRAFQDEVALLLPVLAFSRGLNAFAQFYLHIGFQIAERPLRQVACGAITLLANAVASLLMIREYGIMGAAYGILIGDVVGVVVSILLLRPVFPMPIPRTSVLRVAACAATMTLACLPISLGLDAPAIVVLVATVLTGGICYSVTAYMLDVANLRSELLPQAFRRFKGA